KCLSDFRFCRVAIECDIYSPALQRDIAPVGEDRHGAEFVLADEAPNAIERDDAKPLARAGVGLLRAFGYPKSNLRVAEMRLTPRRAVEPETFALWIFVFDFARLAAALAGRDARLIRFEGVPPIAAVRAPLRNQQTWRELGLVNREAAFL